MQKNEKTTVPNPSVGAEGEQSQVKTDNEIVAGLWEESNAFDEEPAESTDSMLEEMERMSDPAYLPTVSMNELYERVYDGRPPIIGGLRPLTKASQRSFFIRKNE